MNTNAVYVFTLYDGEAGLVPKAGRGDGKKPLLGCDGVGSQIYAEVCIGQNHRRLFTVEKEPVIVHYGKLGRPMEIYWESDDCLMVDGCEHLMEEYAN